MAFRVDVLQIDCEVETQRICSFIRKQVDDMRKSGAVVGLSGGVDSALSAELCVRALGLSHRAASSLRIGLGSGL
jgi:NAD+ synthase